MSDILSFTQLPNVIWDRDDLTVYERIVLIHIIRKTIGWGKKSDGISLSQFVTDLSISKNTAIKAIKRLVKLEIISCVNNKNSNGSCGFNSYEISQKVVHDVNRGGSPDEQGVVHEVNRGGSSGEQTKETITKQKSKEKETKRKTDDDGRAKSKVLIKQNWRPSERCFGLIVRAGISVEFANGLLDEFILYWEERKTKRPGWDATFLSHVKRNFENSGGGHHAAGSQSGQRKTTRREHASLIAKGLEDAIQEEFGETVCVGDIR